MCRFLPLILALLPLADEPPQRPAPPSAPTQQSSADSRQVVEPAGTEAHLPDGEAEFVFQLRSRGLFDLGRQVCLQRLQTVKNLTAQARWEVLFADCCEDEAWFLPQARREELISLAVSRITEFLRNAPVQPETELALRLRQLELLAAIADMEATAIAFRSSLPPASQLAFARSACSQGIQLATAQLAFTDELRPALAPATLRDVRFRLRCTRLELQLADYRLSPTGTSAASSPDKPAAASLTALRQEAEQLLRGLAEQYQFRARQLLAQILLELGDDAALELQLRNSAADISSDAERLRLQILQQTRLLRLQRPSEVLIADAQPTQPLPADASRDPELLLLQLHARLQLCELLWELEQTRRGGDRSNPTSAKGSLTEAVAAFETTKAEIAPLLRGVWQERLQFCERRLELVLLAGPEGANAIEAVASLLAANDSAAAHARLRQITRLSTASPDLRALARMQIGELLLRESQWNEATAELELSIAEFAACNHPRQQAAADLLRLYGLAQLHRTPNSATTPLSQTANADSSRYRTALDQHITAFADQPTITTAREYRARLLRSSRPLEAAADLLAIPAPAPDAPVDSQRQHLRKLALLGDCLLEASLQSVAPPPPAELIAAMVAQWQPWHEQIDSLQSPEHRILSLQRLTAPLLSPAVHPDSSDQSTRWARLNSELLRLLDVSQPGMPGGAIRPAESAADSFDFSAVAARTIAAAHTFRLLAASRLLVSEEELTMARTAIRQLAPAVQREQVLLLLPHLADPQAPGSPALAAFAAQLLPPATAPDRTPASLLQDLPIQLRLHACGAPGEPAIALLTALIQQPLTPEQLQQAADVLSNASPDGIRIESGPAVTATRVAEFWRKVQGQTKAGESAWLEASLQLATIAAAGDKRSEAQRILRTVSVLHPTWGGEERRLRAAALLKSLESSQ
ncbi:MAG: hypothetical protein ACKO2P_04055 [Planctomycetota bacterium]